MNKELHITHSLSSRGTLKEALKKRSINADVIAVCSMFEYAPIPHDFKETSLRYRSLKIEEITGFDKSEYCDGINWFINFDFSSYEKIVIWHGNSVDERLSLYLSCRLINRNLYSANIMMLKDKFSHLSHNPFVLPMDCCSPENMLSVYDRISLIGEEQKLACCDLWNRWSKSEASLRVINRDDDIVEVGVDYFDSYILNNCTNEFHDGAMVMGKTLCDTNFMTEDGFLNKRFMELIKQGKLIAEQRDLSNYKREIPQVDPEDFINNVNISSFAQIGRAHV